MGRGDAVASADSAGAGGAETMNYTVGSDVWYGLVVWNNGATSSTQFTITIERANLVYLPLISKNYVPPSPFTNGGFEQGTTGWTFGGDLQQHTVSTNMPRNGSRSAILGGDTSVYDCNGGVPQDKSAWMYQTFTVPDTVSPTLYLYYRLYSHDKKPAQGPSVGKLRDSFDVYINNERIHRDEIDWTDSYGCALPPNDRGWQQVTYDLSGYGGQNITLRFETWNRLDNYFNTWVYVDDVTVE
jgi:hypothetical protein